MPKAVVLSLLIYVTAIFLAGCNHLQPDPNPGAIESFYPSAEFYACGKRWNGFGVCRISKGADLKTLGASIQGFSHGSMKIDSRDCGVDYGLSYTQHQLVPIPLEGPAQQTCEVTFTVNPVYDASGVIEVHGFRGILLIKVISDVFDWEYNTLKVSGGWKLNWPLFIGGSGNVHVIMNGCGVSYDQDTVLDQNGFVNIPLHDAVAQSQAMCAIDGAVISPEYETKWFDVLVAQHLPNFIPLPLPTVAYSNGKFQITTDQTVSTIIFDGVYKYGSKWSVKADQAVTHRITLLTVKGRSMIGTWMPESKGWLWMQ